MVLGIWCGAVRKSAHYPTYPLHDIPSVTKELTYGGFHNNNKKYITQKRHTLTLLTATDNLYPKSLHVFLVNSIGSIYIFVSVEKVWGCNMEVCQMENRERKYVHFTRNCKEGLKAPSLQNKCCGDLLYLAMQVYICRILQETNFTSNFRFFFVLYLILLIHNLSISIPFFFLSLSQHSIHLDFPLSNGKFLYQTASYASSRLLPT